MRFSGRHALVTGGGSGIGRAVAVRLAAEGASVAVNYTGEEAGAAATLALLPGAAARHMTVRADVADEDEVAAMVAAVLARFGRLDILVNNAGIVEGAASDEMTLRQWQRVLDVNLSGTMLCARAALRHFLARPGGGVIVNCSSVHQTIPKPGFLAYAASKAALDNLTRTLALEYAGRGIRVNAVGPGAIVTPMNRAWTDDPSARAVVEAHIPVGRAGTPEEMAAVFAFLASDDAAYVTGQTIYACGGLTLFPEFRVNWAT